MSKAQEEKPQLQQEAQLHKESSIPSVADSVIGWAKSADHYVQQAKTSIDKNLGEF